MQKWEIHLLVFVITLKGTTGRLMFQNLPISLRMVCKMKKNPQKQAVPRIYCRRKEKVIFPELVSMNHPYCITSAKPVAWVGQWACNVHVCLSSILARLLSRSFFYQRGKILSFPVVFLANHNWVKSFLMKHYHLYFYTCVSRDNQENEIFC